MARRRRDDSAAMRSYLLQFLLALCCGCCVLLPGSLSLPLSLLLLPTALAQPPSEVHLGALFSFTRSGPAFDPLAPLAPSAYACAFNSSDYAKSCGGSSGAQRFAAMAWQVARVNSNSSILPRTNLTYTIMDDQSTTANGFFKAYALLSTGTTRVLVGPSLSTPASNAALVAAAYATPNIAYSASSPLLSNKVQYPYFMRVCHNDAAQGEAMAWFSRVYFQWTRVALLYTNDAYGEGGSAKFLEAATRLNLTVLATASFPLLSTGDEVAQRLDRLKKSGATIFMYFGQLLEWQTVVEQGSAMALFRNDTAWFVSDTVYTTADAITPQQKFLKEQSTGILALTPDSGYGTPEFEQFASGFLARDQSSYPPIQMDLVTLPEKLSYYAIFAADVINVIAAALHQLIEVQSLYNFTSAQLFSALKAVDITGISGRIAFDSNLDRIGNRYILNNLREGGTWRRMGVYAQEQFTPYPLDSVQGGPVVWRDGTTNVPLSEPPAAPLPPPATSKLSDSAAAALVAIAAALLVFIGLNGLGVVVFRKTRVIHAASPVMLGVVLSGGVLVSCAVLVSGFDQTTGLCTFRQWLFNLGFQISFGGMLLKTYRVHKIFNNRVLRVSVMTDLTLLKILLVGTAFDVLILALRTGLAPYELDADLVCRFGTSRFSQDAASALTYILIVTKGLMVVVAAYLSWAVRNLPQLYNESTFYAVAIYNVLLVSAAWIGGRYGIVSGDPSFLYKFEGGIMIAATAVTVGLLFVPKWIDLYASEKQRLFVAAARRKSQGGSKKRKTGGPKAPGASSSDDSAWDSEGFSSLGSTGAAAGAAGAKAGAGGGGGRADGAPQTQSEVENLLVASLSTQRERLESAFKDLDTLARNTVAKKVEIESLSETLWQIQMELDYFREVGRGLNDRQVAALFRERLREFQKSGSVGVGAGGGAVSAMSMAYAAVRNSIDVQGARRAQQQAQAQASPTNGAGTAHSASAAAARARASIAVAKPGPTPAPGAPPSGGLIRPMPKTVNPNLRPLGAAAGAGAGAGTAAGANGPSKSTAGSIAPSPAASPPPAPATTTTAGAGAAAPGVPDQSAPVDAGASPSPSPADPVSMHLVVSPSHATAPASAADEAAPADLASPSGQSQDANAPAAPASSSKAAGPGASPPLLSLSQLSARSRSAAASSSTSSSGSAVGAPPGSAPAPTPSATASSAAPASAPVAAPAAAAAAPVVAVSPSPRAAASPATASSSPPAAAAALSPTPRPRRRVTGAGPGNIRLHLSAALAAFAEDDAKRTAEIDANL